MNPHPASAKPTLALLVALSLLLAPPVAEAAPAAPTLNPAAASQAHWELAERHAVGDGVQLDEAEATRHYRRAAELGDVRAQRTLGLRQLRGIGSPAAPEEAFTWFRLAANQGDIVSQRELGNLLARGEGSLQAEAVTWWRRAAERKDAEAAYRLGLALHQGTGTAVSVPEAIRFLRVAAHHRHEQAMQQLDYMLLDLLRHRPEFLAESQQGAEGGELENLHIIGLAYTVGAGMPHDPDQGLRLLEKAGRGGHMRAAASLAAHFERAGNETMSHAWIRRAAELGHPSLLMRLVHGHLRGERGLTKDPAQAYRWARLGAERGQASAQLMLGLMLKYGVGAPIQTRQALEMLRNAALAGDHAAVEQLKTFRTEARGALTVTDPPMALQKQLERAQAGDAQAMLQLGDMWARGISTIADPREALRWYRRAAESGLAEAQLRLALRLPAAAPHHDERVVWLEKAATQGLAAAMAHLAGIYSQRGQATEAVRWYQRAAEAGDLVAALAVARAYRHGHGTPQNRVEAYQWALRAAKGGVEAAEFELAELLALERAIPAETGAVVEAYQRAAEAGIPGAQLALGRLYDQGSAVPRDAEKAAALYRQAHENGLIEGALALGTVLESGAIGFQDASAAMAVFEEASRRDYADDAEFFAHELHERMGWKLAYGLGVPTNSAAALESFEAADTPASLFHAARLLEQGRLPGDIDDALELYRRAAERLLEAATKELTTLSDEDWDEAPASALDAVRLLRSAADAGHGEAAFALAWLHDQQGGPSPSLVGTSDWLKQAAVRGVPVAMAELGRQADREEGPADRAGEAMRWYRQAAAHHLYPAPRPTDTPGETPYRIALARIADHADLRDLGWLYPLSWKGIDIGGVADAAEARALLRRLGHTPASLAKRDPRFARALGAIPPDSEAAENQLIARLFMRKAEFADDRNEIIRWLSIAAHLRSPFAMLDLARELERHNQLLEAHVWYNIVGAYRYPAGSRGRDRVARQLSAEERSEAEARALSLWRP